MTVLLRISAWLPSGEDMTMRCSLSAFLSQGWQQVELDSFLSLGEGPISSFPLFLLLTWCHSFSRVFIASPRLSRSSSACRGHLVGFDESALWLEDPFHDGGIPSVLCDFPGLRPVTSGPDLVTHVWSLPLLPSGAISTLCCSLMPGK